MQHRVVFSPQDLLRDFPVKIQELSNRLREIVKQTIPKVKEKAYPGWRVIGYRDQFYFCCIVPKIEHVELAFEYGDRLADPNQLLVPDTSQMRRIIYTSQSSIRVRPLKKLLNHASVTR